MWYIKKSGCLLFSILVILFTFPPAALFAQETAQSEMQAAHEALKNKDYPVYLQHMEKAANLVEDKISRPFFQYGLARAYAYNERLSDAIKQLNVVLEEEIEAPMVFLVEEDPAFSKYRAETSLKEVLERAAKLEIAVEPVRGNLVMIRGAGCFLAASVGDDGILLVDTGYPQLARQLEAKLAEKYPGRPIRFIVNTHEHIDHAGGNGKIGDRPVIIAHSGVRSGMQKPSEYFPDFSIPGFPQQQWPDLIFEKEVTISFNGEEVRIIGLPAHSEGDSIVYFPQPRVLVMGDNYFPDSPRIYPGQNAEMFLDVFGSFLATLPEDLIVVSGHGEPVTLTQLKKSYTMTEDMFRFVQARVKKGTSIEEIKKEGEKLEYPARWIQFLYDQIAKNNH